MPIFAKICYLGKYLCCPSYSKNTPVDLFQLPKPLIFIVPVGFEVVCVIIQGKK